mgnify:FL=1
MTLSILIKINRYLGLGREQEPLMNIVNRHVKVLSLQRMPMVVVLTVHYFKIFGEAIFHKVLHILLLRSRRDRWTLIPVVLWTSLEELVVSLAVWRGFVNVLKLVCVLVVPARLVKELTVLSVVSCVIFRKGNVSSVVPRRQVTHSRRKFAEGSWRRLVVGRWLSIHSWIVVARHLISKLPFVSLFHFISTLI